ncbi:hypothetical protein [Methanobrevibacter filiformis]|uniref:Uncharacterized protein n=1 Tax=Methanobrevibacter filiformis TaxID=55758 RepID=A0A166F0V6_9EURY|nr:hypothetical protein [Methanobrevibacter filiformis]KZX17206.1 hypothetical protein MBFIL_02760 [Methanobrevibacter filiformis]
MYTIKGTYDGEKFSFENPLPKGNYNVELKLSKIKEKIDDRLKEIIELSGTWDDEDMKIFEEILDDRKNFSKVEKNMIFLDTDIIIEYFHGN